MMKKLSMLLCIAAAVCCAGCKSKKALLPTVSGKAGEVIVVMDKNNWEGALGNETRELLAGDCPFLPWKEPMYSIVYVTPEGFADLFKVHRNIVMFQNNPQGRNELQLLQDVWSRPQCVINLCSTDPESAIATLKDKSEVILSAIEQAERDRVIINTMKYEVKDLHPIVKEVFGGAPHFPIGYVLKKKTDDFVWIADEKQTTMQGVLMYKYPVSGREEFTASEIVRHRNEILQTNVPGMFDGTYMTTSAAMEPQLSYVKYHGREFAQLRGLWEVQNDYMGGPFVSHSFYSADGKDIIVLEAFVYAPKYDKRQYLRQTESILYSWE